MCVIKYATGRMNHSAIDKLIERYPLIAHNEIEICFAGWDYILLLWVYFTILSCKNTSGGSDINSAYHIENWSSWCDKVTVLLFCVERRQIKFACALHHDGVPLSWEVWHHQELNNKNKKQKQLSKIIVGKKN